MEGCSGPAEPVCFAAFESEVLAIPEDVRLQMNGSSWHPELDCPPFESLRLVRMSHWRFDGTVASGELVLAADVADDIISVFEKLYLSQFPIARLERIDSFNGDDDDSMDANNTSMFNCRAITGGASLSEHSFGTAIDINPIQNPYVTSSRVLPPAGNAFVDRTNVRAGMIIGGDVVVRAFADNGWSWGGNFNSIKDYQHFSATGR